jgi:hypothetical protein
MDEAKERDYKAEYKKFQSSTQSKKYRAELNQYNRKKGTYGNGDGKDASHKGGKIVGFESQSKNRGRAEKSRLKQESLIYEIPASVFSAAAAVMLKNKDGKEVSAATAAKSDYAKKDPSTHKKAKSIFQRLKDKFSKKKDAKPKKQSKSDADFYKRQYESVNEAENKIADIRKILKTKKGKRIDSIFMDVETAEEVMKHYKSLGRGAKERFTKQKIQNIVKAVKKESVNEAMPSWYWHKLSREKDIGKWKPKKTSKELQKKIDAWMKKYAVKGGSANWEKAKKDNAPFPKESVNEAKSKTMKTIGSIIGKRQAQKIDGVLVDMQTAYVIMKVWNALNPSNRSKFEKLRIGKMAKVAWKLMK